MAKSEGRLGALAQLCCVYGHEKEYRVLVARRPDKDQLEAWQRGVVLEAGYKTAPANVRFENAPGKGAWVRVVMGEGRKRQIRETCKQLGVLSICRDFHVILTPRLDVLQRLMAEVCVI